MLRLTVLTGSRAGARLELTKPIIRIGRAPDNDLAFDPNVDLDASAHHAEIHAENGQWVLYDRQSRNGTFVAAMGGQKVASRALVTGDQVQFGPNGPRIGIEVLGPPPMATAPMPPNPLAYAQPAPAAQLPTPPPQAYGAPPPAYVSPPTAQAVPQGQAPYAPPPIAAPVIAPPPAPAPGAPEPRRMGQQTLLAHVGQMIAQQQKGRSTKEIQALVDLNVKKQTNTLRLVIGVLAVLVIAGGAAITLLALRQGEDAAALHKQLEGLPMNDPKRAQIEKKLAGLTGNKEENGRAIYETNKAALFMLVAHRRGGYEKGGFCTAFAIKPNMLASNAHCVRAAEEFENKGQEIWAHLNESQKGSGDPKMFKISRHAGHPDYEHSGTHITPDVGLFELESDKAPTTVTVAGREELQKLGTGDALFVIGFPGRTMNESSPVATFMFSHVGRITNRDGERSQKFEDGWLVQHEGQTTPGTSGSPIFDGEGHVVAINAGGLLESNKEAVYKYAMRIDLLQDVKPSDSKAKKKKSSDDDDD